jgi:hypothetical protein
MDQKLKLVCQGLHDAVASHPKLPTTRRFAFKEALPYAPSAVVKLVYLNLDTTVSEGHGLDWFRPKRQNSIVLNLQGADDLPPKSVKVQFSRPGADVVDLKCGGSIVEILYRAAGTDALGLTVTVFDQIVSESIAQETVSFVFPASAVLFGLAEGREVDFMFSEWLPGKRMRLLYRSSHDGASALAFHRLCDGQGPTVTLIKCSGGYVFGGYAGVAWSSYDKWHSCPSAFLFIVINPHGDPVTRFISNWDVNAVGCYVYHGPIFGRGDLFVSPAFDSSSHTYFPVSYIDTLGRGNATFTGDTIFNTAEMEVWAVE